MTCEVCQENNCSKCFRFQGEQKLEFKSSEEDRILVDACSLEEAPRRATTSEEAGMDAERKALIETGVSF